jgi:hypothetical protein
MNPLVLYPLAILAWRDYANKGEVEDYVAIPCLMSFIFFVEVANLVLLPFLLAGMYIMYKYGAMEIDTLAFAGMALVIGLWAFLALLIAIELVMLGIWKKKLAVRQGVAFLPYLFLGCLAVVLAQGFGIFAT